MTPARARVAIGLWALLVVSNAAHAQDDPLAPAREAMDRNDLATARTRLAPWLHADDPRIAARAQFISADLDERGFAFGDALAAYRSSVSLDPGGRYAARAGARIEYLQAHAEGNFVPLAALERVRTDPSRASDPAAIATLARQAPTFPPGPVRSEALLLVGQAYAGRLHRPADAAPVLLAVARDPLASRDNQQLALDILARTREETGELARGIDELTRLGAPDETISRLREERRRVIVYRASLGVAGAAALWFVWLLASVLRQRRGRELLRAWMRPLPLAHLATLSIGGAFLAHAQDAHSMSPFFAFGLGALVVYFGASASGVVGSRQLGWRIVRAGACAASMLAVSFLVMHRFDQDMLAGVGL